MKEHIIKSVEPGSIAEELEIVPGDVLLSINGEEVADIFDYRFQINDEYLVLRIRKSDREEWELEIEKDYEDDLGIEFENALMSDYRSCTNQCIFCFIDQMPPGMRETLYFKDDDSRLSFLQGNYITLTNMKDQDIDRIIRMNLAPINISVHSTNPELRCKLLHNRFAGEKLQYLQRLYEAGIEMNGQIVCCRGVNDGEELRRSIEDLGKLLPFMRSVSVVPAGITKYREGLYPLELFTPEEAGEIIDMIESYQTGFYEEFGLHFIHASDEWYILAGRPFPEEDRYDGYIQLENGVGMMRLLVEEFEEALTDLRSSEQYPTQKRELQRTVTMAVGKLVYPTMCEIAAALGQEFPGLKAHVIPIRNDFFGETITVTGLITGQDLIRQVKERQEAGEDLGDTLCISISMLRSGEQVFLDDVTVEQVEKELRMQVVAVESDGADLLKALMDPAYRTDRKNDNFVYVQAFPLGEVE